MGSVDDSVIVSHADVCIWLSDIRVKDGLAVNKLFERPTGEPRQTRFPLHVCCVVCVSVCIHNADKTGAAPVMIWLVLIRIDSVGLALRLVFVLVLIRFGTHCRQVQIHPQVCGSFRSSTCQEKGQVSCVPFCFIVHRPSLVPSHCLYRK